MQMLAWVAQSLGLVNIVLVGEDAVRFSDPALRVGACYTLVGDPAQVEPATAFAICEMLASQQHYRAAPQRGDGTAPVIEGERIVAFSEQEVTLPGGISASVQTHAHFTRHYTTLAIWHRVSVVERDLEEGAQLAATVEAMYGAIEFVRSCDYIIVDAVRAKIPGLPDAPTIENCILTARMDSLEEGGERVDFSKFLDHRGEVRVDQSVRTTRCFKDALLALMAAQSRLPIFPGEAGVQVERGEVTPMAFGLPAQAVIGDQLFGKLRLWAGISPKGLPGSSLINAFPDALQLGGRIVNGPALHNKIVSFDPAGQPATSAKNKGETSDLSVDQEARRRQLQAVQDRIISIVKRSKKICGTDNKYIELTSRSNPHASPYGDAIILANRGKIRIANVCSHITHGGGGPGHTHEMHVEQVGGQNVAAVLVWRERYISEAQATYLRRLEEAAARGANVIQFGEFAFPLRRDAAFLNPGVSSNTADNAFIQKVREIVDSNDLLLFTGTVSETVRFSNSGFLATHGTPPEAWPRIAKRLSAEHLKERCFSPSRHTYQRYSWDGLRFATFICFDLYDPSAAFSLMETNYWNPNVTDLILAPCYNDGADPSLKVFEICEEISRDSALIVAYSNTNRGEISAVWNFGDSVRAIAPNDTDDEYISVYELDVDLNSKGRGAYFGSRRQDSLAYSLFSDAPGGRWG